MNAVPQRLRRALLALVLCVPALLATPAVADPVDLCVPNACVAVATAACGDAGTCVRTAGAVDACLPDGTGCGRVRANACPPYACTAVAAGLCTPYVCHDVAYGPLGGIERPATGIITIREVGGVVTTLLGGVFDPATGDFTCTTSAPPNGERTVRCVPNSLSIDWYCAGWILTATTHTAQSQVAGQTSCAGYTGFPGTSSDRTLWTQFACCNGTEKETAAKLSWFVDGAITCQAWGFSAGPKPMGDYTVTCNEPGARVP
jgi:hypothetical protein